MARNKIKWKNSFLFILISSLFCTYGLPVIEKNYEVKSETELVSGELLIEDGEFVTSIQDTGFSHETPSGDDLETSTNKLEEESSFTSNDVNITAEEPTTNTTSNHNLFRNEPIRPGQIVRQYDIEITVNGDSFNGRAIIQIQLDAASRDDDIKFHVEGLDIQSVMYGIVTLANPTPADYLVDDGVLSIEAPVSATSYIFLVEYTGPITNSGYGLYQGSYENK